MSKEQINILKMYILNQPKRILIDITNRDKIVDLIAQGKNVKDIQQELQMSDFEIEDMKEQAKYRKIEAQRRDQQAQIKQDSKIRIIILCIKLGQKQENIAKLLKKEPKEIEEAIQKALKIGLIKKSELQGIQLLDTKVLEENQLGGE